MAKQNFEGPTRLIDASTGRPVRQYTMSGGYYVRASAARHFWGRVLDGVVFLAAFAVLCALVVVARKGMENNIATLELAYNDGFFYALFAVLWFVGLFVYGMVWGTWGLLGERAARMRSVRITDGTTSGAWIGGWRAVAWSFIPLYVFFLVGSMFETTNVDHSPGYIPLDLESGLGRGEPPVEDPALLAKEQAQAQANTELPKLYGKSSDARP
ncbi:hypothetical protein [Actinopolymorpha alba]|uniref:hypothetical protein n=1 Tax=Actinopolymorpha alba TaxID=533267 RepID=UPI0003782B0F|nr:hypothetical protein [Actinopolymorpha alba]